jgi:hypothetical protein
MALSRYWPDEEVERVCRGFIADFPRHWPGLCYLFGVYRSRGLEREAAAAVVRTLWVQEYGHEASLEGDTE